MFSAHAHTKFYCLETVTKPSHTLLSLMGSCLNLERSLEYDQYSQTKEIVEMFINKRKDISKPQNDQRSYDKQTGSPIQSPMLTSCWDSLARLTSAAIFQPFIVRFVYSQAKRITVSEQEIFVSLSSVLHKLNSQPICIPTSPLRCFLTLFWQV